MVPEYDWGKVAVSFIKKDLAFSDLKDLISILKIDQDKSKDTSYV
jgi:hypothetical protein